MFQSKAWRNSQTFYFTIEFGEKNEYQRNTKSLNAADNRSNAYKCETVN